LVRTHSGWKYKTKKSLRTRQMRLDEHHQNIMIKCDCVRTYYWNGTLWYQKQLLQQLHLYNTLASCYWIVLVLEYHISISSMKYDLNDTQNLL
jgi:hypothetical protein